MICWQFSYYPEKLFKLQLLILNCRRILVRQDCLLSIAHGRPPMVSKQCLIDPSTLRSFSPDLSIDDIMSCISRIALDIMNSEVQPDSDQCLPMLSELDNFSARAAPHLRSRDNCATLRQHIEHLTVRLHISGFASIICRPALTTSATQGERSFSRSLRVRMKDSLMDTSRSFLEFQALSGIPMRTWAVIQCVLSSTILLCVWEETRHDPESHALQQQVVGAFSRAAQVDDEAGLETNHSSPCSNQWLSPSHLLALTALQSALQRVPPVNRNSSPLMPPAQPEGMPQQFMEFAQGDDEVIVASASGDRNTLWETRFVASASNTSTLTSLKT